MNPYTTKCYYFQKGMRFEDLRWLSSEISYWETTFAKPTIVVTNELRPKDITEVIVMLVSELGNDLHRRDKGDDSWSELDIALILPELCRSKIEVSKESWLSDAIFCDFEDEDQLVNAIEEVWRKNRTVLLVPSFAESHPCGFCGVPKALEKLKGIDFQCLPVWVENQWQSVFETWGLEEDKRKTAWDLSIWMKAPIFYQEGWIEKTREALLSLSYEATAAKSEFQMHLGRACINGLKKNFNRTVIVDTKQKKSLTGGDLLAVSILLSKWIQKKGLGNRIGIVLPPGIAATVANLACILADKVPVNLNFTAGVAANESAIRTSHIRAILTADIVAQKLPDFPWGDFKIDIVPILRSFSKIKLGIWKGLARILSTHRLANWLGIPQNGGDSEAALLFTSGSSGAPKGVVLTHRNILSNVAQFSALLPIDSIGSVLGSLPVFHSFGFTVTLWWPLVGGPYVVTYPSALEVSALADAVAEHKVGLMVTTPTFLRAFVRRVEANKLSPLKVVITGAEKLPLALLEEFEKKFGVQVCEGYGMTEASPVVAVNRLDWKHPRAKSTERRLGSVGRLMPGMQVRVISTDSGEKQPSTLTGLLSYKGLNLFPGYLNQPMQTEAALQDGWYSSGDIGRLDADGFLWIEGRQSRFSKIAGEMVPHATIEQKIEEVCQAHGELEIHAAVVGVKDDAKGEALIALTTSHFPADQIRTFLSEVGLPNLWIPKIIEHVDAIPTFASGKLDLKACQKMAEEARLKKV